jgi:hypothetical protein
VLAAQLAAAQGLPSANDSRIFTQAVCLTDPAGRCAAHAFASTLPPRVAMTSDQVVVSDWATVTITHATPEPASAILFGSGLAALAAIRRRRGLPR